MLKADGLDKAIIGVAHRCGNPTVVAYDIDKCIQLIEKNLNCEIWEAIEYFQFNVVGSYMGEYTPIFIEKLKGVKELEQWVEENE
jgi:hypothetical protein